MTSLLLALQTAVASALAVDADELVVAEGLLIVADPSFRGVYVTVTCLSENVPIKEGPNIIAAVRTAMMLDANAITPRMTSVLFKMRTKNTSMSCPQADGIQAVVPDANNNLGDTHPAAMAAPRIECSKIAPRAKCGLFRDACRGTGVRETPPIISRSHTLWGRQ